MSEITTRCAWVHPQKGWTCLRTQTEHTSMESGHTFSPHWLRESETHDVECSCGWWADAPEPALRHYIDRHIGEPVTSCDLECCEPVTAGRI